MQLQPIPLTPIKQTPLERWFSYFEFGFVAGLGFLTAWFILAVLCWIAFFVLTIFGLTLSMM